MREHRPATAGLLLALALMAPPVAGQERASPWRSGSDETVLRGPFAASAAPSPRQVAGAPRVTEPAQPMLLSLALPGAGQHVLGERRKWVYLALEIVGWSLWTERRGAAGDYGDRYRDFAWEEARLRDGARADGGFSYYETMSHWPRSGAFDRDPATPGVQPEIDPTTYNGWIWQLATGLHLPGGAALESDPAYASALAYYESRAYGDGFLWAWDPASGGREELARLISESDRRYRHATNVLGAILAHHLVSSIDAYLSARGRSARLSLDVTPGPAGQRRWGVRGSLPWPR